jgi:nucleoside-diphosphate-sugar epimerase
MVGAWGGDPTWAPSSGAGRRVGLTGSTRGGHDEAVVAPPTSRTAALLGADGPVGKRLAGRLATDPATVARAISAQAPDLATVLAGADTLFVLGPSAGPDVTGTGGSELDLASIHHVLEVAAGVGVGSIVALSSAMVYGASASNPVPLTEAAPLRPVAEATHAVTRTELERVLAEWSDRHPGVPVAVLRPVVTVSRDRAGWLRRSPWARRGLAVDGADPPRQFLHADDLVSALVVAGERRLDGAYNVAPDGWLAADTFRQLEGPTPRLHLGPALAERLTAWGFRVGLTSVPPGILPYARHPWVVANDRLEGEGWRPQHTSEEAFVEADLAGPLRSLSPRVRQELSLATVAAVAAAAVAGAVVFVRRLRRRTAPNNAVVRQDSERFSARVTRARSSCPPRR